MSDTLKTRRWMAAWVFPLALLALPNCFLDSSGFGTGPGDEVELEFDPGDNPTSAIMCDIPKPTGFDECADIDETDPAVGMSWAGAAVALVEGQNRVLRLDYSDPAACPDGRPKKREFFEGSFPNGMTLCINCGQIPSVFASPVKACIAKCIDLVTASSDGAVDAPTFCKDNVTVSTNFTTCSDYDGACTAGGSPVGAGFIDPRRNQELLQWTDSFGTDDQNTNFLQRIAETTGNTDVDFNAGAASVQLIEKGDGWVEFQAGDNETNLSHIIGLRESCDKIANCPDDDHGLTGIQFALSLNNDNFVYVLELDATNTLVAVPTGMTYANGDRFRVRAKDKLNGFAEISYIKVAPGCMPGIQCAETVLHTSTMIAAYPLRVDAIFREQNASLVNVTIVRIKPQS